MGREETVIVRTVQEMQQLSDAWRGEGLIVGCVPTMGDLHAGHLSLIRRAVREADRVVVTIFVNPKQFGPTEDFDSYPRDLEADRSKLEREGVNAIFAPEVAEVYPDCFSTRVEVLGLTDRLCGASRPGHFAGVTTVVTKLFVSVRPHFAVFGQKDAQQAQVIRRLTTDLGFDVEIRVSPTIRESDGLARSSRNAYLSDKERDQAPFLYHALRAGAAAFDGGERQAKQVVDVVRSRLESLTAGEIDYVEAVDAKTLQPATQIQSTALLAVAVRFERARLIDNLILRPDSGVVDPA